MKKLLFLAFTLSFLSSVPAVPAMQKSYKDSLMSMPEMSEEELMRFQKEIDAQIDQFVKTLPEEEQRQFYKDVEELSQVMSTMTEEELMQFMDKVLTEEAALMPEAIPQQPVPTPLPPDKKPAAEAMPSLPIEEKIKPVEVKQPEKGSQSLIGSVESCITSIERFLLKAQIIPELPGDVGNWVEKNKVKNWKEGLTWAQLKEKIDELVYRLKKLKEHDPRKSTEYRYLGYVQEPLRNTLAHLSAQLTQYEPRVEAPAFGLGKVSKNSRDAIRQVLSVLAESIYTLNTLEELDKIFKEYGPREQELTKFEEEAHKKASEASKQKPAYMRSVEIGSGEPSGFVATPSISTEQEYYGRSSYPASYAYDFDEDDFQSSSPSPRSSTSSTIPQAAGLKPTQKTKATEERDEEGVDLKDGTKHTKEVETSVPKKAQERTTPEDKKAESYIRIIERQLEKIVELFDTMPKLQSLQTHIEGTDPVDPEIANALRTVTNAYVRGNDQAKALKLHLEKAKPEVAKRYTKQLSDAASMYLDILEPFIKQANVLLADPSKIRADRRYAYIGQQDALSTAINFHKDIATLIPEPASLQDLIKAIDEFKKIVSLEKKKLESTKISS